MTAFSLYGPSDYPNNIAAGNIHVQGFVWTCFHFSWIDLGGKWLGQMVTLSLTFGGTATVFPQKLHHFAFPPTMYMVPFSPHPP